MKKIAITLIILLTQNSMAEEDWQYTANHHYPPMVSAIDMPKFIVDGMAYTFKWQLTGYLDNYNSSVKFFATINGKSKSKMLLPDESSVEIDKNWSYSGNGTNIKLFNYEKTSSLDFNTDEPTELKLRFYKESITDTVMKSQSGSALISTNKNIKFEPYDTRGRVLKTTILPNSDWYLGTKTIHYGGEGFFSKLNKEDTYEVDFSITNIDPTRGIIDYTFLIEADDGLKNGNFIAVIDSADDFMRYPGKNQKFEYKTDDGDWVTLDDPSSSGTNMKQFSSAVGSVAGYYIPTPDGVGTLAPAMETTKLLFNVLDSEWWANGMSSDEAKLLPTINFLYDSSDLSFSKTYRMSLPQPTTMFSDDIVSYKFTLRIKHDWTKSKSLPRFYMKITNSNNIDESASLQIGKSTTKKLEDYLKDGKIDSRWIQAYEF